jgi:hypothetical protein
MMSLRLLMLMGKRLQQQQHGTQHTAHSTAGYVAGSWDYGTPFSRLPPTVVHSGAEVGQQHATQSLSYPTSIPEQINSNRETAGSYQSIVQVSAHFQLCASSLTAAPLQCISANTINSNSST